MRAALLRARFLQVLIHRLSRGDQRQREKGRIAVLTYHSVSDESWGALDQYRISPGKFSQQLRMIAEAGFYVAALGGAVDHLMGADKRPDDRQVSLTFDDGYEDFYLNALPILQRYQWPASVFLVSDLAGQSYAWEGVEHFSGRAPRLMSWSQIEEASRVGIEFQSHSCTHPALSRLTVEVAAREIRESKSTIEKKLGKAVDFFCYPHGEASAVVRQQVRDAGYKAAFSTKVGLCTPEQDMYDLHRVKVRPTDSLLDFACKLYTGWGWREGVFRLFGGDSGAPQS